MSVRPNMSAARFVRHLIYKRGCLYVTTSVCHYVCLSVWRKPAPKLPGGLAPNCVQMSSWAWWWFSSWSHSHRALIDPTSLVLALRAGHRRPHAWRLLAAAVNGAIISCPFDSVRGKQSKLLQRQCCIHEQAARLVGRPPSSAHCQHLAAH